MTLRPIAAWALGLGLLVGCSPSEPAADPGTPPAATDADAAPAPVEEVTLDADQIETIRQLDPTDAEIALAQKTCPDSGEPLGSMGVPVKVDVKGVPVFVCCEGCKDGILADPDATLAKVPQGRDAGASEQPETAPAPEGEGA